MTYQKELNDLFYKFINDNRYDDFSKYINDFANKDFIDFSDRINEQKKSEIPKGARY